ncbi:hypothetical protein RCCS2_15674 [Roseobacter sp. CCS2]|nr:hypothetical protein RCCS2_15674 [Roseobacter sp. CCS2]
MDDEKHGSEHVKINESLLQCIRRFSQQLCKFLAIPPSKDGQTQRILAFFRSDKPLDRCNFLR